MRGTGRNGGWVEDGAIRALDKRVRRECLAVTVAVSSDVDRLPTDVVDA
jgi:hypothetical protein